MKRFVQILNNKAHWIFDAETRPQFAQSIVLVEITGHDEIQEGWDYDVNTNTFTAPVLKSVDIQQPQPTLEDKVDYLYYKSKGVI